VPVQLTWLHNMTFTCIQIQLPLFVPHQNTYFLIMSVIYKILCELDCILHKLYEQARYSIFGKLNELGEFSVQAGQVNADVEIGQAILLARFFAKARKMASHDFSRSLI